MVTISSLKETNQLRGKYTQLPVYSLPPQSKTNRKRRLTSINDQPEPKRSTTYRKILTRNTKSNQKKRRLGNNVDRYKPGKRSLSHNHSDYNPRDERVWPFKFYSVDFREQSNHFPCNARRMSRH